MTLRTYRARTMGDALAEVKKDLGRDAVILRTRTYKVGGWLGLGGRPMVEITASGGNGAPPVRPRPATRGAEPVATVQNGEVVRAYAAASQGGTATPRAARRTTISGPQNDAERIVPEVSTCHAVATTAIAPVPAVMAGLDQELAAIKRMVGQVLQCSRHTALRVASEPAGGGPGVSMSDALSRHYLRLMEQEVASEIADELVSTVRDELTPAELADPAIVRQTLLRHLASIIPADEQTAKPGPARDGRPTTIALIGPTGVGKTTTVAKLAAAYKLRYGKRVGLVTTDTYRIAAVDQLRTYAEIIGLTLKVAMSPTEMVAACGALADCDVILIDTAGRSQRDAGRLDELAKFIDAAKPHQIHLVLSSTSSESVLMEAAQRFAQVKPDRVIFTKLDEAVNFGVLVTVAKRVALKLSFVTTGQEVPDHIEAGRPDRIARLLLDGADSSGGAKPQ